MQKLEKLNLKYVSSLDQSESPKWFRVDTPPLFSVFLIPGLNLRPSKLADLVGFYNKLGMEVFVMSLKSSFDKDFTKDSWIKQSIEYYDYFLKSSLSLRHFSSGFSIGGTLCMLLAQRNLPMMKSIIFAPSIEVPWYGHIAENLPFSTSLYLPSLSPKKYRLSKGISFAGYQAHNFIRTKVRPNCYIHTLCFLSETDQLVDSKQVSVILKNFGNYRVVFPDFGSNNLPKGNGHIIIDRESAGKAWTEICCQIEEFCISSKHR